MKQLFTTLFLLIYLVANSQLSYEKRIEIDLRDGYTNEELIKFDEKGFLLQSRSEKSERGNYEYKNVLYDKDLNEVTTHSFYVDRKFYLSESYSDFDRAHMIFVNKKGKFQLFTLEAEGLKETKVVGKLPKKTYISEMMILGDYAFLQAKVKRKNFLISVNWKNGAVNIIPVIIEGYNSKRLNVLNFEILYNSNEVFMYVQAYKQRLVNIYVIRMNDKGEKKDIFKIKDDIDKNITYITASSIGEDKYIFTGTYSKKTASLAEGLFFCKAEKGKIEFIEYYNFLDLDNFLNYLPERKQNRIEKRKKRKKSRGKEMTFNYRMASHPVIQVEDGYLFLGEAYYPTYRTQTTTTYVNGTPTTTTTQVFDGYRYTHAVIAKFDKNGKKVWDQTFEMYPSYKPYTVKRFISIAEQEQNAIKLAFASHNYLVSKSFSFDGEVYDDNTSESIETGLEGDKTKWSFSNIEYWYGDYFIAYGSQKIKNKEGNADKRKRFVFFISKMKF